MPISEEIDPPIPLWAALLFLTVLWSPQYIELWQTVEDRMTGSVATPTVTSILIFDVPILLLALTQARAMYDAVRERRPAALLALAFILVMGSATVFHPSVVGVARVIRWATAFSLIYAITRLVRWPRSKLVFGALAGMCVGQTALGIGQIIKRAPVGFEGFGERAELTVIAASTAASGTFHHPYYLAAFALISSCIWCGIYLRTRSWPSAALAGVSIIPLALTFSRAGALAFIMVMIAVGVDVLRDPRRLVVPVVAMIIGVGIPGMLLLDDWRGRAQTPLDYEEGGRVTLAVGGLDLFERHVLTGIGPGRYGVAATEELGAAFDQNQPVHNVPLLIAAETGIFGGVIAVAFLLFLARCGFRAGPVGISIFLAYIPFLMLDHFAYDDPQGIAITALWAGSLVAIQKSTASPSSPHPIGGASVPPKL